VDQGEPTFSKQKGRGGKGKGRKPLSSTSSFRRENDENARRREGREDDIRKICLLGGAEQKRRYKISPLIYIRKKEGKSEKERAWPTSRKWASRVEGSRYEVVKDRSAILSEKVQRK